VNAVTTTQDRTAPYVVAYRELHTDDTATGEIYSLALQLSKFLPVP
jgi:hypothetical protein